MGTYHPPFERHSALSRNVSHPLRPLPFSFHNDAIATAERQNRTAERFRWASIANSLLLPVSAALHFNLTFWILIGTNFLLLHGIWISQLIRLRSWDRLSWGGIFLWPLAAFAVLGNLTMALWENQLTSAFPH